jgi:hypothetical protein
MKNLRLEGLARAILGRNLDANMKKNLGGERRIGV